MFYSPFRDRPRRKHPHINHTVRQTVWIGFAEPERPLGRLAIRGIHPEKYLSQSCFRTSGLIAHTAEFYRQIRHTSSTLSLAWFDIMGGAFLARRRSRAEASGWRRTWKAELGKVVVENCQCDGVAQTLRSHLETDSGRWGLTEWVRLRKRLGFRTQKANVARLMGKRWEEVGCVATGINTA